MKSKDILDDLGPLPRIHSREVVVVAAEADFYEQTRDVIYDDMIVATYTDIISGLLRVLVTETKYTHTEQRITEQVMIWKRKHPELTVGEIAGIILREVLSHIKYLVRIERHGDSSRPGGLE